MKEPNLIFDRDQVAELIRHAKESKDWRQAYGDESAPCPQLILVGSDGVYLMSNGIPALPSEQDPKRSKLAYAAGCNPEENFDEAFWNKDRIYGGSDGTDYIDVEVFEPVERLAGLHITENNIGVIHEDD